MSQRYKRIPPRPPGCPLVVDDDERWKSTQIADAAKGIFWGKYGKAAKAALEETNEHK